MQPVHAPVEENEPDVWPTRVHKDALDRAFAWRTLRDAGAHLVFGSDWPVMTQSPFLGLDAALNRESWLPGYNAHNQSLAEAIHGYTRDAAYTEFQEAKKGEIKVGMLADLVLLLKNIFAIDPQKIGNTEAILTLCDGRVVFER